MTKLQAFDQQTSSDQTLLGRDCRDDTEANAEFRWDSSSTVRRSTNHSFMAPEAESVDAPLKKHDSFHAYLPANDPFPRIRFFFTKPEPSSR